jgi:FMN-dependent NADH-azoreductase
LEAPFQHIDSSVLGEQSVSRRLTARAAERWHAAHPGGTVIYRDLATDPIPHLDAETGAARHLPAELRTPAHQASFALSAALIDEIKRADTVLLGLPLYNYGPPSAVKAWIDHVVAPGLSTDPETGTGLVGDTDFIVLASRGGGYGPGTPREGWDHNETWLPHAVAPIGLRPQFITAELTATAVNSALAELKPLAEESLANALNFFTWRMAAARWGDRWWVADRIYPAAGRGPSGVWRADVAIPNAVAQQAHTP